MCIYIYIYIYTHGIHLYAIDIYVLYVYDCICMCPGLDSKRLGARAWMRIPSVPLRSARILSDCLRVSAHKQNYVYIYIYI